MKNQPYDATKPYKDRIRECVRRTWADNPYVELHDGYYVSTRTKHRGLQIDHTDGLGTKGLVHWRKRTFAEAAQDALAMNVNDLAMCGAIAFKTQVHLMVPNDDHAAIVEIMESLSDLCLSRKIAITGGETSVHSNLEGMELSLTVSGMIAEDRKPQIAKQGDRLVALCSSGFHSNGYSLLSCLFPDFKEDWATIPTFLYDEQILKKDKPAIRAAMHITGGAYTKLKEIIPSRSAACLNEWPIPKHFVAAYERYRDDYEMGMYKMEHKPLQTSYTTFNMGIGMILAVDPRDAEDLAAAVDGFVVGEVVPIEEDRKEVRIFTTLSKEQVIL